VYGELVACDGGDRIPLRKPVLRIGRHTSSDIVLPGTDVSNRHAEMKLIEGCWHVFDNNSSNGVWVNGERVPEKQLEPGDVVGFGTQKYLVEYAIQNPQQVEEKPQFKRDQQSKQEFDPYHDWLGIPPEEQPPDYYRLLAIPKFESKLDVIEHAANQRMAHLRSLQGGARAALTQKLLNEVAKARICLLNSEKKTDYDRTLKGPIAKPPVSREAPQHGKMVGAVATRQETRVSAREQGELGELGEYQLLEKLGEGGMGTVYKAVQTRLDKIVALKILTSGRMEDEEAIARFEREMKALGRLDHPNIVQAHDAREIDGTLVLVTEYVDGMDLNELLRRTGPLSVADACKLIRQAAVGLQYAHEHGLVHRDVKPSNLMITRRGQVKLLDLGLARFQIGDTSGREVTAAGQAVGTPDYMAPEQIADTHTVDIRADIYALGCTLYKLLAGRPPFSGPNYKSAFDKQSGHMEHTPPPIERVRADTPDELVAVINRMLAKDPEDRFATPRKVAEAVRPMAADSNLAKLWATAEGKSPATAPGQSLQDTQASQSSNLTAFLQQLPGGGRKTPKQPAKARDPDNGSRIKWAIIFGAAAACLVLVALVVWALSRGGAPEGPALVFNWPASEREETALSINMNPVRLPDSGPLELPCKPGEWRIRAERKGFLPYEEVVIVEPGQRKEVARPSWVRQSHLVLQWPVDQRQDARLEIDGRAPDLSLPSVQTSEERIKMPIEPGKHNLRIARRGFVPFETSVMIDEAESLTVKPAWEKSVGQAAPEKPGELAEQPKPPGPKKKSPPPPETRQEIARRIDQAHGLAAAETGAAKVELAGKLLELGKQQEDRPGEQFVLLQRAMELALDGGDKDVMLAAAGAIGERFEVDAEKIKQDALDEFARLESKTAEARAAGEKAHDEAELATAERQRDERYAKALAPAEKLVAAWDFRGAWTELEKIAFDDKDLAGRLARRRDEVRRMGRLKIRMIAKINAADPPLTKSKLMLRGTHGDVVGADENAISARPARGKIERHPWTTLSPKARARLMQLAIDRKSGDDWLAAGLLALAGNDAPLAMNLFHEAGAVGANVDPYLDSLARTAFARAEELIRQNKFAEAEAALAEIEETYARTPWLMSHKGAVETARRQIETGAAEAGAEQLYTSAAKLFADNDLFELKPLVEKLEADYPNSSPVTDVDRDPSFARMKEAVQKVAKRLVVRLDGKGDFKSVQEAVSAAPPKTVIEIHDNGPYIEEVRIPKEKIGLTIRGKKGCSPLIKFHNTAVTASAKDLVIERVTLEAPRAENKCCLLVLSCSVQVRSAILKGDVMVSNGSMQMNSVVLAGEIRKFGSSLLHIENCFCTHGISCDKLDFRNSVVLKGSVGVGSAGSFDNGVIASLSTSSYRRCDCNIRHCTIPGEVGLRNEPNVIVDSIIGEIRSDRANTRIEHCDVFKGYHALAQPGKNCFKADPKFSNAKQYDYRLLPVSPCLNKASDGGQLGVRFTPEMLEILQQAAALRQRGAIKF